MATKPTPKRDSRLARAGVSGYNKPKRTPDHPKKSHIVVAKSGSQVKTIRFGQQGVSGSPKKTGESASYRLRKQKENGLGRGDLTLCCCHCIYLLSVIEVYHG